MTKIRKLANKSCQLPCEICNTQHRLVEHHISGRAIAGANKAFNLCYICDNCHRLVHEGYIKIDGWFMTTEGRKLIYNHIGN